ncbi:MAG: isochorismatase family cysteine hydrolase [Bacteroidales bacterium]
MKTPISLIIPMVFFASSAFCQIVAEKNIKTPMNAALLVIDVQNQFLPMMSKEDQDLALEMMNWAIWVFRENKLPVIRVYHTSEEWGPAPGSSEFEFPESLKVNEDDLKVVKTYPSAFTQTELDGLLKKEGINTLFLCGLSSVGCVLATWFDATAHDYKAFLVKDALLSHKSKYTEQVQDMFNAMDLETIMYMLEKTK